VTLLTPWVGSQGYEQPFRDGLVLSKAGGQPIEQYQYDGNHCLATADAHPGDGRSNMLVSYAAFYNPLNLLLALPGSTRVWLIGVMFQMLGMIGAGQVALPVARLACTADCGPIERLAEFNERDSP